jgi:hypothetical protein
MENDMSKTYTSQELVVLSYLEPHAEGTDFMELRNHFFNTVPHGKELFSATLTALSMKRLITSRLHEKALWMGITDEGKAALLK